MNRADKTSGNTVNFCADSFYRNSKHFVSESKSISK